jgi:hypothetical protein
MEFIGSLVIPNHAFDAMLVHQEGALVIISNLKGVIVWASDAPTFYYEQNLVSPEEGEQGISAFSYIIEEDEEFISTGTASCLERYVGKTHISM